MNGCSVSAPPEGKCRVIIKFTGNSLTTTFTAERYDVHSDSNWVFVREETGYLLGRRTFTLASGFIYRVSEGRNIVIDDFECISGQKKYATYNATIEFPEIQFSTE